jgi:hypothetical protein
MQVTQKLSVKFSNEEIIEISLQRVQTLNTLLNYISKSVKLTLSEAKMLESYVTQLNSISAEIIGGIGSINDMLNLLNTINYVEKHIYENFD